MTLTEEQVTEFRTGTVNDLLLAAKGGTTDTAGEAKRFKSLALAGGVCSAVLALALVFVLITGTGSKSGGSTTTTTAPLPLLEKPADMFDAQPFIVQESQAPLGIQRGDRVTLAGVTAEGTPVAIHNVFVRGVLTETKDSQIAGQPKTVNKVYQIAVPNADQNTYLSLSPKMRQLLGGGGGGETTTTAPATTQPPPATQPATTPPSS